MLPVELILACTVGVAASTVAAIAHVESGDNPIALNINGVGAVKNVNVDDAIRQAHAAIDAGRTVDMGYMQVNSTTAAVLGFSIEQMFDPCTNLKAGAEILRNGYQQAVGIDGPGQRALQSALSVYNTGSRARGFSNGYVARYYGRHSRPAAQNPYTVKPTVFVRFTPKEN